MTIHLTPAHVPSPQGQAPALGPRAGPGWAGSPPSVTLGAALRALTAAPRVSMLVRPDRVVAVAAPSRPPRLPRPAGRNPNPSNVIKLTS
jgi:hypothetical protein